MYAHLERVAHVIADAASAALSAEGVAHSIQFAGSLFSIAFAETPPRDYAQMKAQDAHRYPPFFHAMLDAGVSLPPSVYEAWFVSAAHDDAAVDRILDALPLRQGGRETRRPALFGERQTAPLARRLLRRKPTRAFP